MNFVFFLFSKIALLEERRFAVDLSFLSCKVFLLII